MAARSMGSRSHLAARYRLGEAGAFNIFVEVLTGFLPETPVSLHSVGPKG